MRNLILRGCENTSDNFALKHWFFCKLIHSNQKKVSQEMKYGVEIYIDMHTYRTPFLGQITLEKAKLLLLTFLLDNK